MKWILFTGTWRLTNHQVELEVRKAAREVISRGDGIVTGGATGVDFFAMDEAKKVDLGYSHLKIIIPAKLESYIRDYRMNWCQAPITLKDIEELAAILLEVKNKNPAHLIEMPYEIITQEHYNLRHTEEIKLSDEVYAFQVNESTGTQDTINKAIAAGLKITLYKKYKI